MGRGGKKKGKGDKEKIDLDVGSLSMTETESSTSVAEKKEEPSTSAADQSAVSPPQEEAEEEFGLGLGERKKKRPRKKKKESSDTAEKPEQSQALVTPTEPPSAPHPVLQAPQPSAQRAPQPFAQPTSQPFAQPTPQVIPEPSVQRASHPAVQLTPHPAAQLTPQVTPQPVFPPSAQQGPKSAPQQTGPPVASWGAKSAGPSAGRGRGRGWRQYDPQTTPVPQFTPPTSVPPPQSSQPPPTYHSQPGSSKAPVSRLERQTTDVVCRFKIPDRRVGKIVTSQSRPLKVLTNYLEMKIKPLKIHRYDVSIKPDRPKKIVPKSFALAKAKHFPKHIIAFDQKKNCYSIERLWTSADERFTTTVEMLDDNGVKMTFEIIIKFTGIVDLGTIISHMENGGTSLSPPMEAIQCVDVILQQGTLENYVKAGRQFFKQPRNPIDLGYGLEMWTGLFQSAIFTSRAFINIDVAHKGFPRQQTLIDALVRDFKLDPTQPLDRQRGVDYFQQFLKGLRVKANIGGAGKKREYICNSLVDPPSRLTFPMTDSSGRTVNMTVEKYFHVEKKFRLRYPDLNCVWVGPKDKKIYYPMELLEVSYGQALNKQLNEAQLRTMVRQAATPPSDRMAKIKEVISNMNYSAHPCFRHFQMQVSNQFLQVDAKVLPAPKLDIGAGRTVDPRRGVWQANRFLKASNMNAWGLMAVDIDSRRCDCQNIISMMIRVGESMGMSVAQPKLTNFNVKMTDVHRVLLTASEKGINLMIVIVPGRYKDAYDKVKRIAELDVGIVTQCIKDNTVMNRMNEQTIKNILLKINSKLMGVNQALEARSIPQCIRDGGVMVVGADVTHPSPEQSNIPSIAAVTASFDTKCFMYNIELSIQTPKHEIIVEFEDMMFDHLKVYKSHQNCLPRKIFVFRDGVSEGQFAQVMNSELVAVQRAYSRLEQKFKPEILFLLVQKRHHTRFFLGDNNPQNVDPGTVVDTDIVHVRELDFYLVSHQAIKGTARPTRYHVVCNDGHIPSDEVEQLAYYLCHLYARCMRAVSYPAPTYYAHLACLRARSLTSEKRYNNADLEKKPQRLRVLDRMLQQSRMFFV